MSIRDFVDEVTNVLHDIDFTDDEILKQLYNQILSGNKSEFRVLAYILSQKCSETDLKKNLNLKYLK